MKLFKAELYKILGNRRATCCMIWIFPAMTTVTILFLLGVVLLSETARQDMGEEPILWTAAAVNIWNIPNNPIGRLLLLGFTAVLFGGEYQWNTWKSIVPRNRRVPLILTKFLAIAVFVVFAFVLTSILWSVGQGLVVTVAGHDFGPRISGEVLRQFAEDYGLQMMLTFVGTIIAAGYAALAGIFSRSILGSVIAGFVISLSESLSFIAMALVALLLNWEWVLKLYRFTPTYNLENISTWIHTQGPMGLEGLEGQTIANDSVAFSVLILGLWVLGLISATAALFQRQDIVN